MSVKKTFTGTILSMKMDKTIIVSVEHIFRHRKYPKLMKRHAKFAVHNTMKDLNVGDTVRITETKPISKTKFFTVESKVTL